jgi:hypothetical protein
MGSLQTHESMMSKTKYKDDEKIFYMKRESSRDNHNPNRGWANSDKADCYNKQREKKPSKSYRREG